MKLKKIHKYSFAFFILFLISFTLSVSASQIFFVLSFLTSIPAYLQNHNSDKFSIQMEYFPRVFWASFFIYLGVFLATAIQWSAGSNPIQSFWSSQSELHDVWMIFAIPLGIYHSKSQKDSDLLKRIILVSFLLCLVSGIISLFTPYRLGRFISLGFQYPEGERLQHFAGEFLGRFTYLPIGLMNTHLTFGGIYGILSVSVFFSFLLPRIKSVLSFQPLWKKIIYLSIILGNSLCSIWILIWNQSRSIWISILFILFLFGFYKSIYSLYQNKQKNILHFFLRLRILSILSYLLVFLLLAFTLITYFWDKNWLLQRSIRDLTESRTTENQRYFIYKNSFKTLEENWVIGIGNGQFTKVQNEIIHKTLLEKPWLLYELYITPKGHAHNDFLQFWIAGGLISGIAWLFFWGLIFQKWFESIENSQSSLGWGAIVIFISGIFQCYMLDDEVALPFYAFVGLLFREKFDTKITPRLNTSVSTNIKNTFPFILVICVSFLSLGIYLYRNSMDSENIFIQKRKVLQEDNKTSYELEGCLTHIYTEKYKIRKEPFWIKVDWPNIAREESSLSNINIEIEILDRDTFDQDKEYKAHNAILLSRLDLEIDKETKWIKIPNSNVLESDSFPGNVRFRDFRIHFMKRNFLKVEPSFSLNQNCSKK